MVRYVESARACNIYLFRNVVHGQVIVSKEFKLQNSDLKQIGDHRYGKTLRRDHWTPFAVLHGLGDSSAYSRIYEALVQAGQPRHDLPLGKYRMPLSPRVQDKIQSRGLEKLNGSLEGGRDILSKLKEMNQESLDSSWQVPLPVQYKTLALKEILENELKDDPRFSLADEQQPKVDKPNDLKETSDAIEMQGNESQSMLTMFWERDEYRWTSLSDITESEQLEESQDSSDSQASSDWPWFIRHEKLELIGAQIPDVPGVEPAPTEPYYRMTRKLFKNYARSSFDGLRKELSPQKPEMRKR